ncbi:MAG: hypothetical protein JWN78_313, partial [Bacteroidota bacterium]|nr:hypothetical protein [Bacteroidota bacterium]
MYRFYKKKSSKFSFVTILSIVLVSIFFFAGLKYTKAQSTASYSFATNATSSLAADLNSNTVDMTTGTTSAVAASTDDAQSALASIGFDFWYMGVRYTQFSASDNGVVGLGVLPGITTYTLPNTTIATIAPFGNDMRVGTNGIVRSKVVGTSPNRCLVIEWSNNMIRYLATAAGGTGTFQVRLYETTGVIQFMYGTMTTNAAGPTVYYVGFSNSTTANNIVTVNTATNVTNTTATPTVNTYTASSTITELNSAANGSRRTYNFTPTPLTAPSNLTFSNITSSSYTLNWTDNASGELGYAIYYSTDGTNYTYLSTTAANATSLGVGTMSASTLYYWRIYPVKESLGSVLSGSQATNANVTHLVISQVYGGGGNAGATYLNDFVELFNPTGSAISITGWSIQYISSGGTVFNGVNLPSGSIQPGSYFLAKLSSGGANGSALPTADVTGVRDMAASGATVVLNNSTTLITSCSQASVIDLVGYGTTASTWCYEGTGATGTTSSTNSAFRKNGGCTDSDNNTNDFTVAAVSPRNSATAVNYCYATKLSFTTPADQVINVPFSITVNSTDAGGTAKNVATNTLVTLTSNGNAGAIAGTTTGTITAGTSSVVFSGVSFPSVGSGVTITATATSGQSLLPFTCGTFNVTAGAPTITSLGSSGGCTGSSITINGTNFTGATAANVKIGGTAVTSITSNSGIAIVAVIGSGTTGNVTVTIGGNTATSVASFTVNPLPTTPGNPTSNSPECTSPGVTLTRSGSPTGGDTWYWQTTNNGQSTANSGSTYNVTSSGTYYIDAQSSAGCWSTTSGSLAVTVVTAIPSISASPSNATVAAGSNASFSVTASNSPTSYIWEVNDGTGWSTVSNVGVYSTATTATLNITAATLSMNGYQYRVTAVNICGNSTVSSTATLTVTYCSPTGSTTATTYISNVTITGGITNFNNNSTYTAGGYGNYSATVSCSQVVGSSVNFSITGVYGTVGVAIWVDWNQNGIFETGEKMFVTTGYIGVASGAFSQTGSFTVPAGALTGNTRMRVVADFNNSAPSNPCIAATSTQGEAEDYTFNVAVPAIPTITSLGSSGGCEGSSITINGTNFTGATAANVKIGGTAVSSITSNTGTVIVAVIGSGTTGNVTVTIGGNTATSVASFTVNSLPTSPGNPTSNSPQCTSPGVTLTRSGTPTGGDTWYWQTTNNGQSTANSASTYNVTASGTYYIDAQSSAGCWSSASGSLAVTVVPAVPT